MSDPRDDLDPLEGDTEYRPTTARSSGRRVAVSRFTPGTLLGDRYRIVALLGSGGMGEVYRADDLKLGQQVALKFLPEQVGSDPHRLERLYAEVRIGRQVSHPNVCRLYDIGEWEGHHFLAMEYVDGEDLASLLRRIGKLPHDKAIELARDICAGLAAAHGIGIIHRDLKPANIMIDGRGTARITDFGLAAVAEDLAERSEVVGTPLYMAPEQLTGSNVSAKTDLYALGLILFEMFTGRRLFESAPADLAARRSATRSQSLSSHTRELDPAIQRVILRCLEEQPEARPASIHSVIAALPGGDPLQAAVDAGETPSPQMVAAAGEAGDLQPRVAWPLFVAAVLGIVLVAILHGRAVLFRRVPLPKEPAVLIERSKSIIERAGYPAPADSAVYFNADREFFEYARTKATSGDPWKTLATARPSIFVFGYRQSPRPLVAANAEGRVVRDDPPRTIPGMAEVFLDTHGRLLSFAAVPPDARTETTAVPRWSVFFEAAGGDFEDVRPDEPRWTPPVQSDRQFAWTARFRGDPSPVRIEAASHSGKPVWFEIVGPWRKSRAGHEPAQPLAEKILSSIGLITGDVVPFIAAFFLARRNLRRGRGDRRGATRLALFVFACWFLAHLFRIDHVSIPSEEWFLLMRAVADSLFQSVRIWMFYVALEPYVRRQWPHLLIAWTRLMGGRWRDPMVGRDILIGSIAGVVVGALRFLTIEVPTWFGGVPLAPIGRWMSPLVANRHLAYLFLTTLVSAAVALPLLLSLVLIVFLAVLRRRAFALAGVWLLASLLINDFGDGMAWRIGVGVVMATIAIGLLARYGVLAFAVASFLDVFLTSAPITLDPAAWYFGRSLAALVLALALAAFGFYISLGQKPLFAMAELDEG